MNPWTAALIGASVVFLLWGLLKLAYQMGFNEGVKAERKWPGEVHDVLFDHEQEGDAP